MSMRLRKRKFNLSHLQFHQVTSTNVGGEFVTRKSVRVNTVQKVKRKNKIPKYVGSFTAEVRTVYFFQVSSPFRGILRRDSKAITAHLIAFGGPRYTNILQNRSGVALQTNICPEIFFDHLKR
ncbi:uncharacterized protein LOC141882543 isoform X2 [Acropora palmata]|uniref:uncharacterized protein LOC141882543 isoform X2 n=1 Tax=Acropora palmata TaxID=6131 RepID=UPI003DA0583B